MNQLVLRKRTNRRVNTPQLQIVRGRRANNRRNNRRQRQFSSVQSLTIREPGRYMPSVFNVVLRYTDTVTQRSNIGTAFQNWRYRSSAYDPDPSLLTGAIPGFNELVPFYRHYLVKKMVLHLTYCNQETVGVVGGAWPSLDDPGDNTLTASDIIEYSNNAAAKSFAVTAVTGLSKASINVTVDLVKLYGRHGLTDMNFSALTTGNPLTSYYVVIGATPGIGTFSFPAVVRCLVDYHITFFGYTQLTT